MSVICSQIIHSVPYRSGMCILHPEKSQIIHSVPYRSGMCIIQPEKKPDRTYTIIKLDSTSFPALRV